MKKLEYRGKISSLIDDLSNLFPNNEKPWFRGQSDYEYKLIPTLFRKGDSYGYSYNETQMYYEFIRRFPEHSTNHRKVFEWLTLMQHYGLPTRLLDWTTNLLVALYFSCAKKNDNNDGAVFIFEPSQLITRTRPEYSKLIEVQVISINKFDLVEKLISEISLLFGKEIIINGESTRKLNGYFPSNMDHLGSIKYKNYYPFPNDDQYSLKDLTPFLSRIVPYYPPHLNSRIKAQHGCFTIHGGKYFSHEAFINFTSMEDFLGENLIKVRIKNSDKEAIKKELSLSGINEATLFPEMEHQAKEIKKIV